MRKKIKNSLLYSILIIPSIYTLLAWGKYFDIIEVAGKAEHINLFPPIVFTIVLIVTIIFVVKKRNKSSSMN